jgi:hypothetical protein
MKLSFVIKGHDHKLLSSYISLFTKYLDYLNLWLQKLPITAFYLKNQKLLVYTCFKLTKRKRRYTVIRSIHIYSTSREQFEKIEHRYLLDLHILSFDKKITFISVAIVNIIIKRLVLWLPSGFEISCWFTEISPVYIQPCFSTNYIDNVKITNNGNI